MVMVQRLLAFFVALNFLMEGGEDMMAVIYASLIINKRRTFSSVPGILKQQVADILIDLGVVELIDDPNFVPTTEG